MRALFRLFRWMLALPFRFLGHRYVRIAGVLIITTGFLAYRPMDPAFYGACGGFLVLSLLARPLGRWITPKQRKTLVLPAKPARPAPKLVKPAPPPPPPRLPEGPRRPAPSPATLAVSPFIIGHAPDEAEMRSLLPAQLQRLIASAETTGICPSMILIGYLSNI